MAEWSAMKTFFLSKDDFQTQFVQEAAKHNVHKFSRKTGSTVVQKTKLQTYHMYCPNGGSGSKHNAILRCSFGGRVLERPDGRWMLKEIDWEHDCGHERGDPTGQPRASSSATSKSTSQHRSFSPPKPKSATKDTFTISSMNGPSSRLPSFTKTTQKPKPKPIVTIPEVEIDPLQDSFSQRTVSKPKARKRRRISASPTSDADNRGVKEESPFFDPTLPDFQTLMHRPNSASSPKSQTRDDTSLSQRCSPIRDSQVTDERPRDTYTPQEYLPRARQSQLALDPVSKGSDIRTSAAAAPVSDSSQPHEGQVPSRGLATHSRHISRSPESTVNSSISITNSMDQWSTSSERLLSPLVDEAAPLKAWLNSLNPGLGKAVGDRLFRIGITSSERLCSGLTSEQWKDFVEQVIKPEISRFDCCVLKTVVAKYIDAQGAPQ